MKRERAIAIIPARGGSKRIPRKNIRPFLGKPIIAYSIEAALNCKLFDEVMVSTDDEEIASVARQYGASIPFMRSQKASDDYATTADVLNEVLDRYNELGKQFEFLSCIYSTAPFVTPQRLKECFDKLINNNLNGCYPVVQFSYPIQRSLVINNDVMVRKWPEFENSRSQDLEPTYHDAGQFYFYRTETFRKGVMTNYSGIVLSELEVQDLDTETDWKLAEIKYQLLRQ
ncbi:MAG: pseudaminic acid cytidylyltransferase [Bacteroidales bacterium]|nr:pseudaminic acid cytidylyltransferase [Bacteroidales bacterium]